VTDVSCRPHVIGDFRPNSENFLRGQIVKGNRGGMKNKPSILFLPIKAKKMFCHCSTEKYACFLIHFQNTKKNGGSSKCGTVTKYIFLA